MEFTHIRQAGKRGYSLKIDSEGRVFIRTNKTTSENEARKIIEKHKDWIEKHLGEVLLKKRETEQFKLSLKNGDNIKILGENFTLRFLDAKNKRAQIEINGNFLDFIGANIDSLSYSDKQKLLRKFFAEISRDYIYSRTRHFANRYGFEFNNLSTKDQKTRWGSCSSKKNLNYSWRLMLCPKEVLDYVVIHEVCHLREMNHSKRFWDLVRVECPNYKVYKKWLKENGSLVKVLF